MTDTKLVQYEKIKVITEDENIFTIDISGWKERVKGRFQNQQGDHTTAYSLILNSLQRILTKRPLLEIIEELSHGSCKPVREDIHSDLGIFFHLYTKVMGKTDNFLIRGLYREADDAHIRFMSFLPVIDLSSPSSEIILPLITYLYKYILMLQFLPFSTIEVEGKGGGYHGESIKYLENSIQKGIKSDVIAFFAKFFDERAIKVLIERAPEAKLEITAYQMMGFIQALRGYPEAKKYFYENSQFGFGQSKLQAITDVIFSYSKRWKRNQWQPISSSTDEDRELTLEALSLINKLRRYPPKFIFTI